MSSPPTTQDTAKASQLSFIQVARLLWDTEGWRYDPAKISWPDAVIYRETGLRFFLDQSCVCLRCGHTTVYDTGPFAWLVFIVLCLRLQNHLTKRNLQ